MTMRNSINSCPLCTTTLVVLVLYLLLSPASCFNQQKQQPPSSDPGGWLFEEKSRLGSTPPSCHNKCNECHPCMAVQVPTTPGNTNALKLPAAAAGLSRLARAAPMEFFDASPRGNSYTNYKPLGWKCRCQNHLFNP
ncbi:EPIDERMAL PATTERNING FACTOR-like protein 1 [Juglans microcarpa x Juglans regia]|uniref:EPIDERMAL PATTERNING FACTOR-like protein 1 n=1 Tax=Juglans microcarpa x Juglans regia TaxID=2249226 RepID=UPI001B7DA50E|nr:EPIDERMAL PATTERNING FACTOR-like protein 1 [Juglans microcarpa x Juglans regia]